MTKSEKEAFDKLKQEGWEIYRNGWPDFLLVKRTGDSVEVRAVEVKIHGSRPSEGQQKMFSVLGELGIPVSIMEIGQVEYALRRMVNRVFDRLIDEGLEKEERINESRDKILEWISTNPIQFSESEVYTLETLLYNHFKEHFQI